jgi:hypothetical protein
MNESRSFFPPRLATVILILLFGLGLAIRLYDLTDLPLDFHPARQLLSALKTRGMYYQGRAEVPEWQRQFAVQQWKSKAEIEPEIVERLAAFIYRLTGEQLWVGRVLSSLFWLAGGVFLYMILRRSASPDGAILGIAFYLFLPYGIIASRSFQPDPLMVMFIILFWWAILQWAHPVGFPARYPKGEGVGVRAEWGWAMLAGLFGGLAILIKFSAAFFVIGGGLGVVLGCESIRQFIRRPQAWVMIGLGILPGALYLIHGILIAGFLSQQFSGRFIPALLASPAYYLNWIAALDHVLGGAVFALALLGVFFFGDNKARRFMIGLWGAYFLYGLYFDYHIWSHDYYNLPLIPIAALSLAAPADWFMARLTEAVDGSRLKRLAAASILAFGLLAVILEARTALKSIDYRPEAQMWAEIAARLGRVARLTALTPDYGSRLAYWGWLDSAAWPVAGDIAYHSDLRGAQADFEARFQQVALKRDFFLVTLPDELGLQPLLQDRLAQYPVYIQGEGYVVYDLR